MITARRMREKMAREAAGQPEPPPPRPTEIPTHEHDRIVRELNKAHAAELASLRAQLPGGAPKAKSEPKAPEPPALAPAPEPEAEHESADADRPRGRRHR